jgi:hypothetical protein
MEQDLDCVDYWRTGQCPVCTRHCPVHQACQQMNRPLSKILQEFSTIILRTVRYADCSVSHRSNDSLRANGRLCTATMLNSVATKVEHRSQRSPDCPVWHRAVRCSKRTRRSNGQLLQMLTDALTWRAPDSEQ